ncbi:MAG: alpha/beta fold hydrolase [Alphaproteobacteria bacterium]
MPDFKMPDFVHVETNGIRLRCVVEGQGPLVILVHGWPESWYSWRHQIAPLVAAGYRVCAPDVRGYGGSDKPQAVEAYDMVSLTGDIAGLIAALGADDAILVGHDWGAPIVYVTSILHRDKIRAVCGMSIPYTGRPPVPASRIFEKIFAGKFFYMNYFQTEGVAEAEFEADLPRALATIYQQASGERPRRGVFVAKPPSASFLEGTSPPETLPGWLTEADLAYYVSQFEQSGMRGPINRYRNFERDWEALPQLAGEKITQPSFFIAGARDPALKMFTGADTIGKMKALSGDFRGERLIEGIGHWVQQEAPRETNAALLGFLKDVG